MEHSSAFPLNSSSPLIPDPGEVDIYTFTGTAGQRLYLDELSSDSNLIVRWAMPTKYYLVRI